MIKILSIILPILLLTFATIYFINPGNIFADYEISSTTISPLKKVTNSSSYVNTNLWTPNFSDKPNNIEINGKSGLVYNLTDDNLVFIKNAEYKGSIASMVKVMTAIVSIDNYRSDQTFVISKQASEIEEDSMGILEGEKYTLEQMLYGLFLPSGNDTAFALAEEIKIGDYKEFVKLMNLKAKEIGMENTTFSNPSGLQEENEFQESNIKDVLIMSRYALKNYPLIMQIAKSKEYYIEGNNNHHEQTLYNQNFMLEYSNIKGLKTGYTPEAGLCMVVYAIVNGKEVIAIVLNSDNRKADMTYMLDYAMGMIE